MRSSCERPTVSIRTALVAAALALALGLTPAPALAAGKRHARAAAAVPTQVTLTGPSTPVRYATAVALHARLSAGATPLPGRQLALLRDGAPVANAATDASGTAAFKVKATRDAQYQAQFTPASPQDVAAYLPGTSATLSLVVRTTLRVELSSPLRAGHKVVGVPSVPVRLSGVLAPSAGGSITIRVLKGRRQLRKLSRPLGASGKFALRFKPRGRGAYTFRVQRHSGDQAGVARSARLRLLVVRSSAGSGSRGPGVRALQRRLSQLGYLTPLTGSFGDSTARAVLAFRKVNGMARTANADKGVFGRLERGGGGYRLRYPKAGRHVEFDWSRQVLVLAEGSRVVRIVHASSGKPSTPTVFGTYHFYSKTPGFNSHGMYYSNYFVGGYAIHGYASVPTYAASHGCIRIPIASAISVYRWVRLGDRISIYR